MKYPNIILNRVTAKLNPTELLIKSKKNIPTKDKTNKIIQSNALPHIFVYL